MRSRTNHIFCLLTFCLAAVSDARATNALTHREWKVDGVVREALIHVPPGAKTEATPVVFAFHGHGGSMAHAARTFGYHKIWPQATVVYMQGLKTPGVLTDPMGKRAGWQMGIDDQGDRDLKFFDMVMASLNTEYQVDRKRIYATGHSNGGAFTYLLWAARGEQFAAFAPSGAAAPRLFDQLKPKPVLHVAGKNDPLVKFAWQKRTLDALRQLNQCGGGKPWEKDCTWYESKLSTPVVTFIHEGTHKFPEAAPAVIVKFFKQYAQP